MSRNWADWVAIVLVLAIVYVLVRPRSKAVDLVTAMGDAMTAIVQHATDIATT